MIQAAGMTAMAFNDGIYFQNDTSDGTFNNDIIICYWSNGWGTYNPMPASTLDKMGFKLINTHGDYYWVLGKGQCSASKASRFDVNTFQGSTISDPAGSMFCIWADYPGAETEADVISKTADTIAAFGKALPEVKKVETVESKTVTKGDVTVTAPGLTDLTVAAADAPAIDAAAEGKVLAYNVTPATANGSYKESGTVTLPIPEGWDASRVRGFVQNTDGTITPVNGTSANGEFTFTVPHFSVLGIYELAANAATVKKEINLTVGGTATDTIDGEYSGAQLDNNVASVVGGEPTDKPGTTTYEPATLGKGTFYVSTKSDDTAPTPQLTFENAENGQYYIKNSAGQYVYPNATFGGIFSFGQWRYSVITTADKKDATVKVREGEDGSIVISRAVTGNGGTTAYLTLSGTTFGAGGNSKSLYLYSQKTTPGGKETTLTFTGRSVGTTSVKIGDVTYNIIVSDKAPDDALTADTITLEHWITNARVATTSGATGDDRNVQKISKTTAGIQSEDGVAVETLAYVPGYWAETAVHYWQAVRLDKDHLQTADRGSDQTDKGTTLTHIRYYGGAWQYETADGVWHYFLSTDQFVIYYLQKTKVTKEVDTYVKDWGYGTDETTPDLSDHEGQVALTFAVVYPDGTVSPAEGDMYANSTTIFNYWDGRDIGIVAPKNNSDYNISKITVTDGTRDGNSSSNVWYTTDTIKWNKKTNVAGKEWYDETEVWNKSSGTTPMVNGTDKNIDSSVRMWPAKNTAKLVLIYLEPVEKETNLNVQYIDLNANNHVFHSYQVAMKYQSDDVPTFTKALMLDNTVIGDKGPWNSNVVGNTNYLPDEAYVTNSSNTKQTFRKDITTIPEINGIYASGLYKYMKADISEDGKTLRLYYDLSATGGKTFVVDFGLPVEIPFDDFEITNASNVTVSFDATDTKKTERTGNYGVGKIDMTAQTVTYTLYKTLDAKAPIPVYVSDGTNTLMRSVNIIPATSVYYEDSFATFTNADSTKNVAQVDNAGKGIWTKVTDGTTQTNVNQALEELGGTTNTKNVYGYDPAYANSSKFSMGSATKVTVAADTYQEGKTQWPTATFTFKGTGFDVISLTDNTSGTIFVTVKDKATGKVVKSSAVNNYYGYKYQGDKWVATENDPNCLYQIPVMKIAGLDYAEYEVMIQVAYASFLDEANAGSYNFWLDAIRVYDPMGKDNATYEQDNEGYPQYIKLRDELVKTGSSIDATPRTTVFIDGAAEATIDQYKNYGPNNEVYLAKGQAISFTIPENINIASIQIGAKAPNGNSAEMNVNGTKKAIPSATEMYYQIATQGKSFTVTNTGNGLLSLTNLKITFNSKPNTTVTLAALSDEDQANAVAQVRALFAAPAEPFNPDRFDASWSRNVRKGETAKLTVKTSEDVEAITVNGETIDSFTERHERTGWGWWAKTVTYREFIYTTTADVTRDYTVCAVNAAGVRSEEKTATLTVRPSVRDWLHGIFGKWF